MRNKIFIHDLDLYTCLYLIVTILAVYLYIEYFASPVHMFFCI